VVLDELCSIPADTAESHAWVLMPDHLHWLFRLGERLELSRLAQQFKSRSAIAVNRFRQVSTPVWQPGFYDHQLRRERDLAAQARYIVGNPIRRGICGRIEDYPYCWSRWVSSSEDLL
jgi:putative transposase